MTPPLIDRSWLRRGGFSPMPRWAKSISGLLEETTVAFWRDANVRQGGTFEATSAGPVNYLTAQAHVEIEEQELRVVDQAPGVTLRRSFCITLDIPADPADYPKRGDRVKFTDPLGYPRDLSLVKCDMPEGVADHLEVWTEGWE